METITWLYQINFISNCIIKNEYQGKIYKAGKIDPNLHPIAPQNKKQKNIVTLRVILGI